MTDPLETFRQIAKADMRGAMLAASDVLRLGGVAIVGEGGVLRYLHRGEEPRDIPSNADVLAAVDSL